MLTPIDRKTHRPDTSARRGDLIGQLIPSFPTQRKWTDPGLPRYVNLVTMSYVLL